MATLREVIEKLQENWLVRQKGNRNKMTAEMKNQYLGS